MQQVKNKKKGKAQGVSFITRKNIGGRKPNRLSQTGHRKLRHGTNGTTEQPLVAFSLTPYTKEIPTVTVRDLQGESGKYTSEADQLKLLEDLYPIIKQMKGFVEPKITDKTTTALVLKDILSQFERLGRYENWSIEKGKEKFLLKAKHVYGGGTACYIAVDFMAKINRTHARLHEFLIYAFRLASQQNGVPLFYDWVKNDKGGTGQVYEWLEEKTSEQPEDDEDKDKTPSCSLAEALSKQDLFINSIMAQYACNLLWKMFREASINYHGLYVNLETLNINPISVCQAV